MLILYCVSRHNTRIIQNLLILFHRTSITPNSDIFLGYDTIDLKIHSLDNTVLDKIQTIRPREMKSVPQITAVFPHPLHDVLKILKFLRNKKNIFAQNSKKCRTRYT